MPRINIEKESDAIRSRDRLSAFTVTDKEDQNKERLTEEAVREINRACDHIYQAVLLFKREKEPIEIFIPRINNFNDEMLPESVIAVLVAIAMPYLSTIGYDYKNHVEIQVGTTLDAEIRILGMFIERIAEAISPSYDPNRGRPIVNMAIGQFGMSNDTHEKLATAYAHAYEKVNKTPTKRLSSNEDSSHIEHDESIDLDSAFTILDLLKPEQSSPTKDTPSKKFSAAVAADRYPSMPALLTTSECAAIIDSTPLWVAKKCKDGTFPAVKCGREWRINRTKFLEMLDPRGPVDLSAWQRAKPKRKEAC